MNSEQMIDMLVVSKSGEFTKYAKATNRPYQVRYLTCQSDTMPGVALKLSIYGHNDRWPNIYVFSKIRIPLRTQNPGKLSERDVDIDGNKFQTAVWLNNFKQDEIQILGKFSRPKKVEIDLANCVFTTTQLQHENLSISASDLGFTSFPPIFRKGTLEGTITIVGEAELRMKKMPSLFGESERKSSWERVEVLKPGSIDLSKSDLGILHQVVGENLRNEALARIHAKIRSALSSGKFLSVDDVNAMLTLEELYGKVDAESVLYASTMRKDYEPEFFKALKESHNPESKIYYSDNGFIFDIKGCHVWEEPKYGAATYLFTKDKMDATTLVRVLSGISRSDIISSDEVKAVVGFVRRVIHPKDPDNEEYFDRWLAEVQRKL